MPRRGDRERARQAPKRMSKSVAAKDGDPDRVPGDDGVCPDGGDRERARQAPKRMIVIGKRCGKARHGERKRLHEMVEKA